MAARGTFWGQIGRSSFASWHSARAAGGVGTIFGVSRDETIVDVRVVPPQAAIDDATTSANPAASPEQAYARSCSGSSFVWFGGVGIWRALSTREVFPALPTIGR